MYFRQILFLSGQSISALFALISIFTLVGITDLLGLVLIGEFVSRLLGVESAVSILSFNFNTMAINELAFALIMAFVVKAIIGVLSNYYIFKKSASVEAELKSRLIEAYQSRSYLHFISRELAEYITSINNWVPQYSRLVFLSLIRLVAEMLVGVMTLSFLLYLNPLAMMTVILLIGSLLVVYFSFLKSQNLKYAKVFKSSSIELMSLAKQALEGFKEIRSMQAETYFLDSIKHSANLMSDAQAKSNVISNSARYFFEFGLVLFIVSFPLLLSDSSFSDLVPILAVFAAASMRIVTLFGLLNITMTQLSFNRQIVSSLYRDLSKKSEVKQPTSPKLEEHINNIELQNVCFRYDDEQFILKDVSLKINSGEKIAIIGQSGSGKSTLLDILLGFVEPQSGNLKYHFSSGRVSSCIHPSSFTYIPQGSFMINGSVIDNLLFQSQHDFKDDSVQLAVETSNIDFLGTKKDRNKKIGDSGSGLSGGQVQRLALARALLQGKDILVLDESTNAVDNASEKAIISSLLKRYNSSTIIYVTHREGALGLFDIVYRVESGHVVRMVN